MLFILYTTPMRRIFKKQNKVPEICSRHTDVCRVWSISSWWPCISYSKTYRTVPYMWMAQWMFKLNDDKTDMVIFMSKYHLQKYGLSTMAVVTLLSCRWLAYMTWVCSWTNTWIWTNRWQLYVKPVTTSYGRCVVFVATSPHMLPKTQFGPSIHHAWIIVIHCWQAFHLFNSSVWSRSIQNKAARLITQTRQRNYITPVLKELDWLPVRSRIKYKVLVLAYKCVHGQAPSYLSRLLKTQCRDERTWGAKERRLYGRR